MAYFTKKAALHWYFLGTEYTATLRLSQTAASANCCILGTPVLLKGYKVQGKDITCIAHAPLPIPLHLHTLYVPPQSTLINSTHTRLAPHQTPNNKPQHIPHLCTTYIHIVQRQQKRTYHTFFVNISYSKRHLCPLQLLSYALEISLSIMEAQRIFNYPNTVTACINFDAPS